MKIKIEHKNKRLETVGVEEFELDIYCQKLSQDLTGLLSDLESFLDNFEDNENIDINEYYRKIRHKIFDIAGAIKRLPDNIIKDEIIKKEEPQKGKITLVKIFDSLR